MSATAADRSAGMVRIERVFAAPRELVFDAWTKRELLLQWYAPHGCTVHFASIDVRPGGRFHSCIHNPRFGDCWIVGVYREIVRPERIVYTLTTADSEGNEIEPAQAGHDPRWPRQTLVTVTLAEVGGGTMLTLEQTVSEALARHTGAHPSWLEMLDRMAAVVATGMQPMRSTFMGVAALALASGSMTAGAAEQGHGAYAAVNGIRMYYETYGPTHGVPLVLLHGGGSTLDSTFGRIIPFLARDRRVIAVEEQAHGRTSDRDAPVRFTTSADDVATLLDEIHVQQADVFGFSNGASIALQVAIRHPRAVRKLVFASSFTKKSGAQPQLWEMIGSADFAGMPQGLKDAFLKVNPDPAQLRRMHDKDLERMRHFEDVPDADLRALRVPTLVLLGDRDVTRPEHAVELTHLIPGARLLVLPGGHGEYMGEATMPQRALAPELTADLVGEFLDAP